METMAPIFILDAARTPFGALGGALRRLPPARLGGTLARGLMARQGGTPGSLSALILGQGVGSGSGPDLAWQVAQEAGLSPARAWTLSAGRRSGLEALLQACEVLQAQGAGLALAGGLESASRAPYLLPSARWGVRLGEASLLDALLQDGPPPSSPVPGPVAPSPQDHPDRLPVPLRDPSGGAWVEVDEDAPPLPPWDCPPGDGAALALLAAGPQAAGRTHRARVLGWTAAGGDTRPREVANALLGTLGLKPEAVDALVVDPLAGSGALDGPTPEVAPIAPGLPHPWGALGAAALLTLLRRLEAEGGRRGLLVLGDRGASTLALALERTTP